MPNTAKKLDKRLRNLSVVGIIYIIKVPVTAKILDGACYGNKKRCIS